MSSRRVKSTIPGFLVLGSACLLTFPLSSDEAKPAGGRIRLVFIVSVSREGEAHQARAQQRE